MGRPRLGDVICYVSFFILFQVRKEELESFLEIAGELSVKGMTKQV